MAGDLASLQRILCNIMFCISIFVLHKINEIYKKFPRPSEARAQLIIGRVGGQGRPWWAWWG